MYRKNHSMYKAQDYPLFQASPGVLERILWGEGCNCNKGGSKRPWHILECKCYNGGKLI